MSYEFLHFRDSKMVIEEKGMTNIVKDTLGYVDDWLPESPFKGRLDWPRVFLDTNLAV